MGQRKLGRASDVRGAMLRSLTTSLLYNGKIVTTQTRAKEVRRIAEKLVTIAVKERDNYTTETVTVKVPRKNKDGARVKETKDGKKVTVFDEQEKTVKKDMPTRLNARRKILSVLYPVTQTQARKKRSNTKKIDMAAKLFDEYATKYAERNGGYTRIIKIGVRKGDGAPMAIIEMV